MQSLKVSTRLIVALLCLILPTSQLAFAASDSLTPDQARKKIQKIHVDHPVFIREYSGVEIGGRILSLDDEAFTMQTSNRPETTTIPYSDVAYVHSGLDSRGTLILVGAVVGVAVVSTLVLHHEYDSHTQNQPTTPTFPAF